MDLGWIGTSQVTTTLFSSSLAASPLCQKNSRVRRLICTLSVILPEASYVQDLLPEAALVALPVLGDRAEEGLGVVLSQLPDNFHELLDFPASENRRE